MSGHMRLLPLALAASLLFVSATARSQGVQTVGNGCGGNAGAGASLDLVGTLDLGSTSNMVARGMPAPTAGVLLYSFHGGEWNGIQLPLPLQGLGITGCSLALRPDMQMPFWAVNGTMTWPVRIPRLRSYEGQTLYGQAFFIDPLANAAGIGATPGVSGTIAINEAPTSMVSSITQWGITFVFAHPVRAGQFAGGDWFVVGEAPIVDMQPPVAIVGGRTQNGAMIDPDPSTPSQGYDSNLYSTYAGFYDPALNCALGIGAATPLVLAAGHSLVKTISSTDTTRVPRLRTAAVLTTVPTVPRVGSFRPPYAGTDHQVRFDTGMLDLDRLLALSPTPGAPDLATETARFERVWLDHAPSWIGRMMHPTDNMPDYGRDLASLLGEAMLLCNTNLPLAQRALLAQRIVQIGIDDYGVLHAGGRWPGTGGHGSGRKMPILFAGALLRDPAMLGIGQGYVSQRLASGTATTFFGEDCQTFYVAQTGTGVINWGYGDYSPADVGRADWGFAHVDFPQDDHAAWDSSPYRVCCTANAWVGHVLVARMMGLVPAWNHPALFDYTDRYMTTATTPWERAWSPWVAAMWDSYRQQF